MPGRGKRYPMDFQEQMVKLVRGGRTPASLAREYEPSAQTIRNWVAQADVEEGRRPGMTREEQAEIARLKRELKRLRMERDILKKAAAWFDRDGG